VASAMTCSFELRASTQSRSAPPLSIRPEHPLAWP
jgi:hypothetical protein